MRRAPVIVGTLVAATLVLGSFELAEGLAASPVVHAFDDVLATAITSLRSPAMTRVMIAITQSGSFVFSAIAALACAAVLLRRGRNRDALVLGSVVAVTAFATWLMKILIGRERPAAADALLALPSTFSFPSGHTTASLALGGMLAYLALRSSARTSTRVLAALMAIAYPVSVGVSRVYLGVHWPSDVLASWMLAGAVLAVGVGVREALR